MQRLSYSKPYRKFDLYGKDETNSWLTKEVSFVKQYYAGAEMYLCIHVKRLSGADGSGIF